jgi:hypothetical protein
MTREAKVLIIQGNARYIRGKLRTLGHNGTVLEVLSSDTALDNFNVLVTTLVVRWR